MSDLIEKLSDLRSQFNCFDENKREAYHTLSEAIKVISERPEPCEDALKKIKNASFVGSDGLDYVETLQALDALKDVICVTLHVTKISKHCSDFSDLDEVIECEDAVSRKTAIEAVMDLCKHYTPTKSVNHPHVDFVIEALQDLPSVTPKRKTGKWILLEECANAGYYCSECRKRVVKEGWSGTVKKIKFCPNCGADMRQREENK